MILSCLALNSTVISTIPVQVVLDSAALRGWRHQPIRGTETAESHETEQRHYGESYIGMVTLRAYDSVGSACSSPLAEPASSSPPSSMGLPSSSSSTVSSAWSL